MMTANRLAPLNVADPALDAMIEDVANRLQAGDKVDLEAIARRDPDRAELLRQLLPSIRMMADIGRSIVQNAAGLESLGSGPEALGVIGDYRIIREIGRGGMGVVYDAEQISLGRQVALKVLPLAAAIDPKQLTRFHIEAQAAAHLHHTNIVPVYAVGCERGMNYYAMQFIEGPSLAAVIREFSRRNGPVAAEPPGAADMASVVAVDLAEGRFELDRSADATEPHEPQPAEDGSPQMPSGRSLEIAGPIARKDPSRGRAYFRAVAHLGIQAAEALDYAHRMGVVHRDIKPANLLVDVQGNLWITDFGLARMQEGSDLTLTGDLLGTLRYMSPEQALSQRIGVDYRTDIYSLGVTLYELVTLKPAFDGHDRQEFLHQVAFEEPRPLRRIDASIPRELETIVQKAMAKEPSGRYATAQELADDLRLFLDDKPIRAKRPTLLERATKWARRHQAATVAAFAILVVAVVALSVSTALIASAERRAVADRTLAQVRARESQYESLMQQILRLRLTTHFSGWSDDAWNLIRQASRLRTQSGKDWRLEGLAVATHSDLDARPIKRFTDFGAHFVAFDRDGRRLLMGSTTDLKGPHQTLGTKLWDDVTQELIDFHFDGQGPVGFRPDGTPIEFVADAKAGTLALWDLAHRQVLHTFEVPGRLDIQELSQLGMLPDGSLVAAPVLLADDRTALVVWNGETGQRLHQLSATINCVAFSQDHSLVAGGDEMGRITIWSVSTGRVEKILQSGQSSIHCLAFRADRHRSGSDVPRRTGNGWLLAAGDAGGTVTVWDLGTSAPRAYCRGSYYDVYAVAFSPDGMTLASAGRHTARVWDATTGHPLLDLPCGDFTYGLAFSPDGRRLALGNLIWNGVIVSELENGRGIQSLRGLSSQVASVIFSADGRQIAALSHDWRIAIWDLGTRQLKHLLDPPRGLVADNAALAFSPDGRRFAAATGGKASGAATMWDLVSGRELKTWPLPPGLHDTLAFHPSGNLLSSRCETRDGRRGPYSDANPREYPRICRVRNLTGPDPTAPLAEFDEFNWAVDAIAAPQNGTYFVVVGRGGPQGTRVVNKVIDGSTGKVLGVIPMTRSIRYGHPLVLDPGGKVLAISTSNNDNQRTLFAMPSIKMLGTMDHGADGPCALGPAGQFWASQLSDPFRFSLRRGDGQYLATLGLDSKMYSSPPNFSADGGRFAWGNTEGVVFIADLREIQRRLSAVSLGW